MLHRYMVSKTLKSKKQKQKNVFVTSSLLYSIETMVSSGEFQNLVVTSGIGQKGILENASLLESDLVA